MTSFSLSSWRRPEILLMVMAGAMPIAFWSWSVLLNNFTIEFANFTGREIGILQSLREVPGFLSFLVVYLLLVIAEQRLALLALGILGAGVAMNNNCSEFLKEGDVLSPSFIDRLGSEEQKETCHQINRRTDFGLTGRDYVPKIKRRKKR